MTDEIDNFVNNLDKEIRTDVTDHINGKFTRDTNITHKIAKKQLLQLKAQWESKSYDNGFTAGKISLLTKENK